jgi:hypothetical protein
VIFCKPFTASRAWAQAAGSTPSKVLKDQELDLELDVAKLVETKTVRTNRNTML